MPPASAILEPLSSRLPVGPAVFAGLSGGFVLRLLRPAVADLTAQSPDDPEDVHESRRRAEHEQQQQEQWLGSKPPLEQEPDADADDQRRNYLTPDPHGAATSPPLHPGHRLHL